MRRCVKSRCDGAGEISAARFSLSLCEPCTRRVPASGREMKSFPTPPSHASTVQQSFPQGRAVRLVGPKPQAAGTDGHAAFRFAVTVVDFLNAPVVDQIDLPTYGRRDTATSTTSPVWCLAVPLHRPPGSATRPGFRVGGKLGGLTGLRKAYAKRQAFRCEKLG